jgi:hypothetical protein
MKYPSVDDIDTAKTCLGLYIDQMEKSGAGGFEFLKKSYLRLHLFSRRQQNLSRKDGDAIRERLRHVVEVGQVFPLWLPCHNLQSGLHAQQCMLPDEVCHCAQLLNCELVDTVPFETPNLKSPLLATLYNPSNSCI